MPSGKGTLSSDIAIQGQTICLPLDGIGGELKGHLCSANETLFTAFLPNKTTNTTNQEMGGQ